MGTEILGTTLNPSLFGKKEIQDEGEKNQRELSALLAVSTHPDLIDQCTTKLHDGVMEANEIISFRACEGFNNFFFFFFIFFFLISSLSLFFHSTLRNGSY